MCRGGRNAIPYRDIYLFRRDDERLTDLDEVPVKCNYGEIN